MKGYQMKKKIAGIVASSTPEMDTLNAVVPNSFHENYEGKTVVIHKSAFTGLYQSGDRRFHATGGFGCNPASLGHAVFGYYMTDGESAREERYNVVGVAVNQGTSEEIAKFEAAYRAKWSD